MRFAGVDNPSGLPEIPLLTPAPPQGLSEEHATEPTHCPSAAPWRMSGSLVSAAPHSLHAPVCRMPRQGARYDPAVEGVPEVLPPPEPEVMANGFHGGKSGGHGRQAHKKCIEVVTHRMPPRPTARHRGRHMGGKVAPLDLGDISGRRSLTYSPNSLSVVGD
jgi:hypothetical protein